MEFDITYLDKKLVIQAIYSYAKPLGFGKAEYGCRKKSGENVNGLTDNECELILYNFYQLKSGDISILDYHKGKPMKLIFEIKLNGRVLVQSDSYDSRNGKYRFFEALLDTFLLDEIFITKKGYKHFVLSDLPGNLIRPKEQEIKFKSIIKHTILKQNEYGKYWVIDQKKESYIPLYMQ